MLTILSTIIGIVFVILLFSMLASAVMELIAGWLSLRGKNLVAAIIEMLDSKDGKEFSGHAYFKQLTYGSREKVYFWRKKRSFPSYIKAESFSAILMNINKLDEYNADIQSEIDSLPEGKTKTMLQFLWNQANGNVETFRKKIEEWFNEVMDRASGAYKRHAQRWLLVIGLGVSLAFNADVLNVYHNLSINATLREMLADQATVYVNTQPAPTAPNLENPDMVKARQKIGTLLNDNIMALESPLGIGWNHIYETKFVESPYFWPYKIAGWLLMGLAISLGASFWFDLLNKLVNLRSGGLPPTKSTTNTTTSTPTTNSGNNADLRQQPTGTFESKSSKAPPSQSRSTRKPSDIKKK